MMLEASELSKVCAEALMAIHKNKADAKVEIQVASLLNAIKEATEQLKFDENRMMAAVSVVLSRRQKEL